jgi:hypothetical protein
MDVDDEIDRLYGLPLEDFIPERNRAARAAKKAGAPGQAEAVSALRKPTVAAWAVNQLSRQSRREIDLLLDAGHRLLEAQRVSLATGERDELDRARRDQDEAIGKLRTAAAGLLADRASETTLARVEETLGAAAISPEGRELLARGRFTQEASATGWEILEGLATDLPKRPKRQPAPPKNTRARVQGEQGRGALREAKAMLSEAREHRSEATRRLRGAERDQARAREALDDAAARVDAARKALSQAEDDVERAEERLRHLG